METNLSEYSAHWAKVSVAKGHSSLEAAVKNGHYCTEVPGGLKFIRCWGNDRANGLGRRVRHSDGARARSAQSLLRLQDAKNAFLRGCLVSPKPCLPLVFGYCRDCRTLPQRFVPA